MGKYTLSKELTKLLIEGAYLISDDEGALVFGLAPMLDTLAEYEPESELREWVISGEKADIGGAFNVYPYVVASLEMTFRQDYSFHATHWKKDEWEFKNFTPDSTPPILSVPSGWFNKKPERIHNFDSGWSIDLDKVFYIGIPETNNGTAIASLKIGISSRVAKEAYIIHEESFKTVGEEVHSLCEMYVAKKLFAEHAKSMGLVGPLVNDFNMWWGNENSMSSLELNEFVDEKRKIVNMYIEAEFKDTVSKLKAAWNNWIYYKERSNE